MIEARRRTIHLGLDSKIPIQVAPRGACLRKIKDAARGG
jgi:hypothetical protein